MGACVINKGSQDLRADFPEPVAHLCILPTKDAGLTKFFTAPSDPRGFAVFTEAQMYAYGIAAQASQAAELAVLKADIAEYVHIASEQATEIEALRKDAERHNRIAELVLRAVEERRDREWEFMHLSLGEAAEIAATIQRERAAIQTKEAS